MKNIKLLFVVSIAFFCAFFIADTALAGNIDVTNKYAWSNNIGWVNFGTTGGDVTVTSVAITGYAWSDAYGWIHLAPSTSGVVNTSGTLSGQAWGENVGWIDFSGVTIGGDGEFLGNATGPIVGTLSFNCINTTSCGSSDFKVKTGWVADSGGSIAISIIQQEQIEAEEQPVVLFAPQVDSVEILGSNQVRYNWLDLSDNEEGFRLLDFQNEVVLAINQAGSTSVTESELSHNTLTAVRKIASYNASDQSVSISNFDQIVTLMPSVEPRLVERSDSAVTVGIDLPLNNLDLADSGIEFELLLPETSTSGAALLLSGWVQSNIFTFSDLDLHNGADIRVHARNQNAIETEWSQFTNIVSMVPTPEEVVEEVIEEVVEEVIEVLEPITEPAPDPTPEDIESIESVIDTLLNEEDSSVHQIIPDELTTESSFDGQSFTIEVTKDAGDLSDELLVTGFADSNEDLIQFTGATSKPHSVVTLIFNDNITVVVTSDANGEWKTYVSAEQLGVLPGESADVTIEAIAAKGDLKSEKVQVGAVTISRALAGEITSDFETIVSQSAIVTVLRDIQKEVVVIIEEQEEEIQTTLKGVAPVVIASSAPLWGYLPYLPTLIYHFITYLLGFIGRKKQKQDRLFGVVYDSISKEPLGLAIIRVTKVEDGKSKLVATKVTDKQGRYDFLLEPGDYKIEVKKPGFTFPSAIVTASIDGEFDHVYQQGAGISIAGRDEEITFTIPDVPLDPENAEKKFDVANVFKKFWLVLQKVGHFVAVPVLFIGSLISVLVVITIPDNLVNWLVASMYIVLLLLQLTLRPKIAKAWGVVYDLATNAVLPLTTIQLIDPKFGKIVKSRLSDYQGRFNFMPAPGKYVIKANKDGYEQAEVVEGQKDRKPISGEVEIAKQDQAITGDIAMKNL